MTCALCAATLCKALLPLSLVLLQGRTDVLAGLVMHLLAEQDMHRPLQPIVMLLRHQRLEALCALCCRMAEESHVAQAAMLLAEAARCKSHSPGLSHLFKTKPAYWICLRHALACGRHICT